MQRLLNNTRQQSHIPRMPLSFAGYPQQGYNFGILGNTSMPRPSVSQLMGMFPQRPQPKKFSQSAPYDPAGFKTATGLQGLPDMKDLLSDQYTPSKRQDIMNAYQQYYGRSLGDVYKEMGQGDLGSQMGGNGYTAANTYAQFAAQNPGLAAPTNTPQYGTTNQYSWDLGNNQTAYMGASQPGQSGIAAWLKNTSPMQGYGSNVSTHTTAGLSLQELAKLLGGMGQPAPSSGMGQTPLSSLPVGSGYGPETFGPTTQQNSLPTMGAALAPNLQSLGVGSLGRGWISAGS